MDIPKFSNATLSFASGDEGTRQTLNVMRHAVVEGIKDPAIMPIARRLVLDVDEKDKRGEAAVLFEYVKDHIRYVNDPLGLETVVFPRTVIEVGSGDCDDKSVLFAALAVVLGIPARFVAVKMPGIKIYTHVYPELLINGSWQPFEPTLSYALPGRSYAPEGTTKMIVEVVESEEPPKNIFQAVAQALIGAVRGE